MRACVSGGLSLKVCFLSVCMCVCVTLILSVPIKYPPPVCFNLCNRILQLGSKRFIFSLPHTLTLSARLVSLYLLFISQFFLQTEPQHLYIDVCMCVFVCVCARQVHTHSCCFLYSFVRYDHVECLGLSVMSFELKLNKR